jgi:predicted NAD-dependent protein-ADP-ribosyltransferase YbiA (DUF1768 family)
MSDCKDGKDFNPKTCRYIQSCKPGYSRNKDFKCVKNLNAPKRSVGKEKLGLLKGLFSNQSGNGLVNSPTLSKSKRLKKTYPELIFDENGNEIPPLEPMSNELKQSRSKAMKEFSKKFAEAKIKSMKNFLKALTPDEKIISGKEINWNQMKTLARSKGIKLDTDDDKRIFKDLVIDFESGKLNSKPKRVLKTKKVQFENNKNVSKVKSKKTFKTKPQSTSNNKDSKSKTSPSRTKVLKSSTPKKSLSKMTIKDALEIMKLDEIYTTDELAQKYKEISISLHPDKPFDEKKNTPEFKVLNRAFEILNKRIEKTGKSKSLRKTEKFQTPKTPKDKSTKSKISKRNKNIETPKTIESNTLKSISIPSDETILNLHNSDLYNPETVFKFYSLSSDRAPGKGAGEKIKSGDEEKYIRLSERPDWRKMLSNFWIESFELEGKRWQSVEHYYQGSKFKENPDFYNQFSLDSGSDISKDPSLAKVAGGKSGKRKGIMIRPKEIKIDSDFFPDRSKIEMYKAQHAKFTQNSGLASVLKLTRDAKLVHHVRGNPPVVFDNLMYIRSKLI